MTPQELAAMLRAKGFFVGALDHVTDAEGAAAFLCVSRRTIEEWRESGTGPRCWRAARWLYPLDGLLEFERSRQLQTQEPAGTHIAPQSGLGGETATVKQ